MSAENDEHRPNPEMACSRDQESVAPPTTNDDAKPPGIESCDMLRDPAKSRADARFKILHIIVSISISLVLLFFVIRGIRLDQVITLTKNSNLSLVALAVMLYYASYAVRARRWTTMLAGADTSVPFSLSLSTILASFAVNCIVPAKAGDIYRCLSVSRKKGSNFFLLLGSVISERVLDLVCVLTFLFAGACVLQFRSVGFASESATIYGKLGLTAGYAIALLAIIVLILQKIDMVLRVLIPPRFRISIGEIKRGFRSSFAKRIPVISLSAAVWILELGSFYVALEAVGLRIQPSQAVFTSVASTLSNAVPFTPGGLGIYELAARELLCAFGAELPAALAAILLIRLINYWSLILVGAIAALVLHKAIRA